MDTGAGSPRDLTIAAVDGYPLASTLLEDERAENPTIVISGATGVGRRFYADFAAFLAVDSPAGSLVQPLEALLGVAVVR